jgi:hypothetical protein
MIIELIDEARAAGARPASVLRGHRVRCPNGAALAEARPHWR